MRQKPDRLFPQEAVLVQELVMLGDHCSIYIRAWTKPLQAMNGRSLQAQKQTLDAQLGGC
jgi:hypothetical protein